MSTPATTTSTEVAVPSNDALVGLEDIDINDLTIPRLKIAHRDAQFEDTLSGERFDKLDVIILGLVKQRVLWDPEIEDDARPLCKSYDFEVGYADPATFPWAASNFDKSAADADQPVLSCAACPLKEWDSHPTRAVPWCTEQYTLALLLPDADGEHTAPALLTVQKTGIKPAKNYATSFVRAKKPMFTAVTRLSLTPQKRGTTQYAVPAFAKAGDTEPGEDNIIWKGYAQQFFSIRSFVTTPRTRDDNDGEGASPAPAAAAVKVAAKASPAPAATPAAADDDEIPF